MACFLGAESTVTLDPEEPCPPRLCPVLRRHPPPLFRSPSLYLKAGNEAPGLQEQEVPNPVLFPSPVPGSWKELQVANACYKGGGGLRQKDPCRFEASLVHVLFQASQAT